MVPAVPVLGALRLCKVTLRQEKAPHSSLSPQQGDLYARTYCAGKRYALALGRSRPCRRQRDGEAGDVGIGGTAGWWWQWGLGRCIGLLSRGGSRLLEA